MTKFVISRYKHDLSWLREYTDDAVIYDRSEVPLTVYTMPGFETPVFFKNLKIKKVPNIGTDIYDKFTFIIDNYDNLPDVAVYTKANLFKYISKEEFDLVRDNKTFTPLLTKNHEEREGICFYDKDGMYNEINNYWYVREHQTKTMNSFRDIKKILGFEGKDFLQFAPGSNYILPKENILKHPKELYEKFRGYLEWAVYPGEAQLIERGLFYLWR